MAEVKTTAVTPKEEATVKVRFNQTTMVILDEHKFNPKNAIDKKEVNTSFDAETAIMVGFNQEIDLPVSVYEKLKSKMVQVPNERSGNLHKKFEERMADADSQEREYLLRVKDQFESLHFTKPICELVAA